MKTNHSSLHIRLAIWVFALPLLFAFALFSAWPGAHIAKATAALQGTVPPPPNDDFANAIVIGNLPYSTATDISAATVETSEPVLSCASDYNPFGQTVWYAFTPTASRMFTANWYNIATPSVLAIYTGSGLSSLHQEHCYIFSSSGTFTAIAGTTYYFQLGAFYSNGSSEFFSLDVTPPPQVNFYNYPSDPSIFDAINFSDSSYDPAYQGFQAWTWNLGDGTTSTDASVNHRYAVDGNYTILHTATTLDGRNGSVTRVLTVKTHDVAITKFARPQSGRVGQTGKLIISVSNKRYPEVVHVDLYKSTPNSYDGFQQIGYLEQSVPVQTNKKTTDFLFSYTFTSEDAAIGKVSFKAVATIVNARDALSADNAFISQPVTMSKQSATVAPSSESELVDDIANGTAIPVAMPTKGEQINHLYLPFVSDNQ